MKLIKTKNYEEMSQKAANVVSSVVTLKPDCVLGLATGDTPVGMYRILAERNKKGDLDFKNIKTVNLDEYVGLSAEHPQSYQYFMNQNLYSKVNLSSNNTHIPDGLAKDPEQECKRYEELIYSLGGIELLVLGIGNNGHIAFNEPDDSFPKETHVVKLTEDTRRVNGRFFDSLDEVPYYAISMGMKSIMSARAIMLLASGEVKKKILYESIYGPITPMVPASVLQLHPNLLVITDQ
ncbi:MAG: glucosamine-6-phosphate deaminase [Acetivibrionales bacterium]|jgi:glucosamine-6-phosphate deaminase|nr:glucosamine-6-phosphate deaminase [Clostridiaceae bacterium]